MLSSSRPGQSSKGVVDRDLVVLEGLTSWDLARKPWEVVKDDKVVTLEVRSLNIELSCPVCLGILRDTVIVMECLHRFCDNCMQKCLRVGKRECPQCRGKVPSRRSLRRDHAFDSLIAQIYPDLDSYEEKQERYIQAINSKMNYHSAPPAPAPAPAAAPSASAAPTIPRAGSGAAPTTADESASRRPGSTAPPPKQRRRTSKGGGLKSASPAHCVTFVLCRHADEKKLPMLEKPMLRVHEDFSIELAKRFLVLKMQNVLSGVATENLRLTVGYNPDNHSECSDDVADDTWTLGSIISDKKLSQQSVLVLHYALRTPK